jgi:hypothetical protein
MLRSKKIEWIRKKKETCFLQILKPKLMGHRFYYIRRNPFGILIILSAPVAIEGFEWGQTTGSNLGGEKWNRFMFCW